MTVDVEDDKESVGKTEDRLDGVRQPPLQSFALDDPVDHDLDGVLAFLVQTRSILDHVNGTVDPHTLKPRSQQIAEFLAVLALATPHHRSQQHEARTVGHVHDPVDHLADGLAFNRQPGDGRPGNADPGPQEAHVVVNLRYRANRRARILRGCLLLDRYRRRQAVDVLDIGFLHHLEELARIGTQTLDVASLAFGIDGIEGKGRLARPAQSGHDDQTVPGELDVDTLEIVLPRAAYADALVHCGSVSLQSCLWGGAMPDKGGICG